MKPQIYAVGKAYNTFPNGFNRDKYLVSIDFNLEDLYWLQSLVPFKDTFRKDIQDGIDWIEKKLEGDKNSLLEIGVRIIITDNELRDD